MYHAALEFPSLKAGPKRSLKVICSGARVEKEWEVELFGEVKLKVKCEFLLFDGSVVEAVVVETKFTKCSDVGGFCDELLEFSKVLFGGGLFGELFCRARMKTNGSVDVAGCKTPSSVVWTDVTGRRGGRRTVFVGELDCLS